MKLSTQTLISLAAFFKATQAQSAYDAVCSPPSGEEDVEPGLVASYGCGQAHATTGFLSLRDPAPTPLDCAKKCATNPAGNLCTWYQNECFYYAPGTGVQAQAVSNAITIDIRKDWDALKLLYDQSQADFTTCETDAAALQVDYAQCGTDLAACQNNLATCTANPPSSGGPPGSNNPPNSGGPPGSGPSPIPNIVSGLGAARTCNSGGRNGVLESYGKEWEVKCGYWMADTATRQSGNPHKEPNLESCIRHCVNNNCQMLDYNTNLSQCCTWRVPTRPDHKPNQGIQHTRMIVRK